MNWQEALNQIESPEFDANVNVVSGMKSFIRAVDSENAVKEARRLMLESGEVREEVLGRICDLSVAEVDLRYENPHDTPLAVLLWLTYYSAPEFIDLAANYTIGAPNCWYANKLARSINLPPTAETEVMRINVDESKTVVSSSSAVVLNVNMLDYGEKYHFMQNAVANMRSTQSQPFNVEAMS